MLADFVTGAEYVFGEVAVEIIVISILAFILIGLLSTIFE